MNHDTGTVKLNNISQSAEGKDDKEGGRDEARPDPLPQTTQRDRCWCFERTVVRKCTSDDDSDVKHNSKTGEGDEGICDGSVDGCHVLTNTAGEEEESDLENDGKAFDVEWPFLEPIALALTVSTTLDHKPASVPQVPVQPLLPQHRDECGQQRDQQTGIQETSCGDNFAGRGNLGRRNGEGFVWDCGMVEGEEDRKKESRRLAVGIGLKFGINIDDGG